ncbi:MAG: hypothetical protein GY930_05975 [bacterium]|nr:hypothetical protein [bacterium]
MKLSSPSSTRRTNKRNGFSPVEFIVAICVLTTGLLALYSTSVVAHSLDHASEARSNAAYAMQRVIERTKALSAQWEENQVGWSNVVTTALLPGGSIGVTFDVEGLDPWLGAASIGMVRILTDETLTDAELGIALGMPRDLNGDGDAVDIDVTDDATLLPIIVRARWSGAGGNREATQAFYLTNT